MSRFVPFAVTAALIVAAVVVLLIVSDDSRPGEIVVSRSALDAMGSYPSSPKLESSSWTEPPSKRRSSVTTSHRIGYRAT